MRVLLAVAGALGALGLGLAPTPATAGAQQLAPDSGYTLETFELASPLVDTSTPGGRLERGRTVPKIHVLLPEGYAAHPDQRYPVLWLLHGANGGTDTWIPGITDDLPGFPAIVVMPDGGTFGMYTDWWNGGARGGPAWATYHLELLRQTIEDRYRILPGRRWHAIAGISMGGQGALRYAAMLPGYFGSVAGLSAALPDMQALEAQGGIGLLAAAGGGQRCRLPGDLRPRRWGVRRGEQPEGPRRQPRAHPHLPDVRNGHQLPRRSRPSGEPPARHHHRDLIHLQQAPFGAAASAAGADVTAREHLRHPHLRRVGPGLRRRPRLGVLRRGPRGPDRWVYRTIATTGEMWGLRYRFAAPPSSVARFERVGGLLLAWGTGDVTLTGPPGCQLRFELPLVALLPRACL